MKRQSTFGTQILPRKGLSSQGCRHDHIVLASNFIRYRPSATQSAANMVVAGLIARDASGGAGPSGGTLRPPRRRGATRSANGSIPCQGVLDPAGVRSTGRGPALVSKRSQAALNPGRRDGGGPLALWPAGSSARSPATAWRGRWPRGAGRFRPFREAQTGGVRTRVGPAPSAVRPQRAGSTAAVRGIGGCAFRATWSATSRTVRVRRARDRDRIEGRGPAACRSARRPAWGDRHDALRHDGNGCGGPHKRREPCGVGRAGAARLRCN